MVPRYELFSNRVLDWYRAHARDLPWRQTRDPYRIWVSEILLQQTNIRTVIPYYDRFLERFPDVKALAGAPLDAVLKSWEGAGYYARARNLHAAARQILRERGGKFPRTVAGWLVLPGVGRYTAGAIVSIAFNRKAPILDANVTRLLCRYFGIRGDPKSGTVQTTLWKLATDLIPPRHARDFNQALMDLGATVCVPRNPRCPVCPVRRGCTARRLGIQNELPLRRVKRSLPHYEIAVGIVWRRGRILIGRRNEQGLLGGLWEFPGGKLEPGESLRHCVRREVSEEMGIEIKVGKQFAIVEHAYSHLSITMHAFFCQYVGGRTRPLEVSAYKWVRPAELSEYAFPAANRKIIAELSERSSAGC